MLNAGCRTSPVSKKRPVVNAKEVAVENRAEETYYHRTLSFITELSGKC
jgi:hypothetical protein